MLAGFIKLYADMDAPLQTLSALIPIRWSFQGLVGIEYDAWQDGLVNIPSLLTFTLQDVIGFPATPPSSSLGWLVLMTVGFLFLALRLLARED